MPKKQAHNVCWALMIICGIWAGGAAAQPSSILEQILRSREAIVEVEAENYDVYTSPPQLAGIDPRSGKVLALQKMRQNAYTRRGAGVVIHPSGIIVTNAHIIYKANWIKIILPDNTAYYASLAKYLGALDYALLKITPLSPLKAVELADSDTVQLGDEIITVGNSFLLNGTVSGGTIKGLATHNSPKGKATDLIQTSVNLYEGDSGGPLFNRYGQLLGLMTAKETAADHSSFAIPVNKIYQTLMEYLRETGLP